MSKLSKNVIRRLIMQELARIVDEDALIAPGKDSYRDTGYNPRARSPHNAPSLVKHKDSYDDFGGAMGTCEQCGGMTYEGDCMEAGCGGMSKGSGMLEEGGCGCGPADDGTDYSIDTMNMIGNALGTLTSAGYTVDAHHDDGQLDGHKYKHNNYMAKPALYKVAKYAQKLLQMIPDGYELDDWQRHKIAQMSDDISEVYHSLDYDFYDDEC